MSKLINSLTKCGVNIELTMNRFLDDEELYVFCIYEFAEEPAFSVLKNALNDKNYKEAFESAHTLKGVSANLGLTDLFNVISKLVEALRNEVYDNIEQLYKNMILEYNKFLAILEENK